MRNTIYLTQGRHRKSTTDIILDVLFDPDLTVKENLTVIHSLGYRIEYVRIYNYCKERGIRLVGKKTDDEIKEMLDTSKGIMENHRMLHEKNISCSKNRVNDLLHQIKDTNKEQED